MRSKLFTATFAALIAMVSASSSLAATATIDGLSVTDSGSIAATSYTYSDVTSANPTLSGSASIIQGQNTVLQSSSSTPSVGWSPFGTSDTSKQWVSLGWAGNNPSAGSATFSLSAPETSLSFVWGSPSSDNKVELFNGSSLVGTLTTADLTANFAGINNSNDPGYLMSISGASFNKVVFTGGSQAFEFGAVSAVPLPGALILFGSGFTGLIGFGAARRKKA